MDPPRLKFGDFTLIPSDQLLLHRGQPVPLAPKLFDLLVFMVEHRERLLTRDELMKAIWSGTVVEESNLTVNVSLLRKILGNAPDGKPFIETVPRRGYRFHSDVREDEDADLATPPMPPTRPPEPAPLDVTPAVAVAQPQQLPAAHATASAEVPAAPAAPPAPLMANVAAPSAAPRPPMLAHRSVRQKLLYLLLGLGLGALIYLVIPSVHQMGARAAAPRSLAVLPFRNLKGAGTDDFLGFALADAIITKLGYVSRLSVRPSSAVARFDSGSMELRQIAKELGVDTLLTGTYVHEGDDLRLRAQLVDANTQRLLWSDSVNLNYQNLLAVQDRVAQQIVAGLQVPLSPPEAARLAETRSAKAGAYEEYLRGVDLYATNQFGQSIHTLEHSAQLDPDFPLTWAMLGRAYTTDASLHFGGAPEYAEALSAYQQALRLDPAQIEPRVYMANMFTDTGLVEDAVPLLQEALKVNPNHAEANWELSYAYRFGGLLEESVARAERARRLDPSVKMNNSAINAYLYLGRYEAFLGEPAGTRQRRGVHSVLSGFCRILPRPAGRRAAGFRPRV